MISVRYFKFNFYDNILYKTYFKLKKNNHLYKELSHYIIILK